MRRRQREQLMFRQWEEHCKEEHGATYVEYGFNIRGWHRNNHKDCQFRPKEDGGKR